MVGSKFNFQKFLFILYPRIADYSSKFCNKINKKRLDIKKQIVYYCYRINSLFRRRAMKISFKGDYALKVILHLSLNHPEYLCHIENISKMEDIPKKFLEQILLELKRGGFVQSKKGPSGGYFLAREPRQISLGEIVRFIEGTVYPISCIDPSSKQTCREVSRCVFTSVWQRVEKEMSTILDNINFQELKEIDEKIKGKKAIIYQI
jgi:Rrf2 family protein